MFKKIKKFLNKIEPYAFLTATFILFSVILLRIFIYSKNLKIFENNSLNLIVQSLLYLIIILFFVGLYYKIFRFTLMTPSLSVKEFNTLWKKRQKISQELKRKTEKKKNSYTSKEFKKKYKEVEKIKENLEEKSVSFKNWFQFCIFSLYFGSWKGLFQWSAKNSAKYFWAETKNFFSSNKWGLGFRWYKLKKGNYIIDSFEYPYRKAKN